MSDCSRETKARKGAETQFANGGNVCAMKHSSCPLWCSYQNSVAPHCLGQVHLAPHCSSQRTTKCARCFV